MVGRAWLRVDASGERGWGGETTADSCCSNDSGSNSTAPSGVAVHTAPDAASQCTPNASAAVSEVTRVLTTHSTDELFVLLQILGKYWRARAAHAPDDDITIDEWVPGTRQNRWHRALCRRCERARALLQHEPRSEAWPSTVANVLAPMVQWVNHHTRATWSTPSF